MPAEFLEKLKTLPQPIYQAFMADDVLCEEACFLYDLPAEKISAVSGPLGTIFVGDMKLGDYPSDIATKAGIDEGTAFGIAYEINKRFFLRFPEHFTDSIALQKEWEGKKKPPVIGEKEAQEKATKLKPWLFEKSEEEIEREQVVEATRAKLPLLAALGKYARLGEQAITASRLTLKGNPEPVRGSLVNWLKVYRDELGVGYHDPVLRAKFLFNSPNAKNITSEERERLNFILRSVEENVPLDIDLQRMEIVFPSFSVAEQKPAPILSAKPNIPPAPVAPIAPTPPLAPKRQDTPSSAFVIRPASQGAQQGSVAPIGESGGLRIGKGMHFTSLESKPSASKPSVSPDVTKQGASGAATSPSGISEGGNFSFSSNHSFQAEHSGEGELSINHPAGGTLPSGQAFFRSPAAPQASSSAVPSASTAPVPPQPQKPTPPKMSPFQIRPVSLHGKTNDDDMGRIVDLRYE